MKMTVFFNKHSVRFAKANTRCLNLSEFRPVSCSPYVGGRHKTTDCRTTKKICTREISAACLPEMLTSKGAGAFREWRKLSPCVADHDVRLMCLHGAGGSARAALNFVLHPLRARAASSVRRRQPRASATVRDRTTPARLDAAGLAVQGPDRATPHGNQCVIICHGSATYTSHAASSAGRNIRCGAKLARVRPPRTSPAAGFALRYPVSVQ